MPRYSSGTNKLASDLTSGDLIDASGRPIVNVGVGFGDVPASESLVSQIKYGVPNGQFNMLPPDAYSPIGPDNALPYWKVEDRCATTGAIEAYIETLDGGLTYGLVIDPTGAVNEDELVLTTRIPVLTDTNLSLRQKLVSTLTKSSAYSGTNQWNLTATATYYTHGNDQLDSYTIGTAAHNASWTQLGGTTTTGGSAISGSAAYVDIEFKLAAVATVTDTTTVTINSVLLADSQPAAAGGAFLVTETFTASGTWTRPTGVDYVSVALIGGGNGGDAGGAVMDASSSNVGSRGGGGGASGQHLIVRDIYVGDVATVAIGVGAGGAGGVPGTANKPAGGTFPTVNTSRISSTGGSSAAAGGASSFGSYVVTRAGTGTAVPVGPADSSIAYGYDLSTWAVGGTAANTTTGGTALNPQGGSATFGGGRTIVPLQNVAVGTGVVVSGGTGYYTTTTSGTGWSYSFISGQPGSVSSGLAGSGAGAGGVANNSGTANSVSNGGSAAGTTNGGPGGGPGWLLVNMQTASAARVIAVYGGPGGNAGFGGGGGGGGGPAWMRWTNVGTAIYNPSTFTAVGGDGGDGSDGYVVISYVA